MSSRPFVVTAKGLSTEAFRLNTDPRLAPEYWSDEVYELMAKVVHSLYAEHEHEAAAEPESVLSIGRVDVE